MKRSRWMLGVLTGALCMAVLPCTAMAAGDVAIDEAHFPDKYFRLTLNKFDHNDDGFLSESEVGEELELDGSYSSKIQSLKGIEYFTNLKKLTIMCENLNELDLSQNTGLESLVIGSNNNLTELDVSNNTALTFLNCQEDAVTELDVSHNLLLKELYCYGNKLTALDVIYNHEIVQMTDLWYSKYTT